MPTALGIVGKHLDDLSRAANMGIMEFPVKGRFNGFVAGRVFRNQKSFGDIGQRGLVQSVACQADQDEKSNFFHGQRDPTW